jgi:hypothetical protein
MNMSMAEYVRSVRALNDQFRKTLKGGTLIFTSGVMALGGSAHEQVLQRLAAFEAFDTGNDPHGEHDFGCLEIEGQRLFWKIDYYDLGLERLSTNPANPSVTRRVLTVMLAEEY